MTINEGLTFSDGTPITAANYLAQVMAFSTPVAVAAGMPGTMGQSFVGYKEFNAYTGEEAEGTSKIFSGIRLLDEYTFSVTVSSNYLPYYFAYTYAAFDPAPLGLWLGDGVEIKDDGEGCYLSDAFYAKDDAGEYVTTAHLNESRYDVSTYPFSGAYVITDWDQGTKQCTLTINPEFKGNFEGQTPSIETVVYVFVVSETQLEQLKTGAVDVLSGITGGDDTKAALAIVDDVNFSEVHYQRAGYGKVEFECDFGPTMFPEVRQAITYLLNRTEFCQTFTGGYGVVVDGPYSPDFDMWKAVQDDIELIDGAGDELDLDAVACGKLSPAFFGSALTNFGVEPFLKEFLRLAPTPRAYTDTLTGEPVDPCRDDFSGFVFKIQANMDKNHRDRIAFVRICSGKFERGMDAFHVQGNRKLKLATGTSMMADDRAIVDEAYAGDIVGLFDPGIFSIGDTVCSGKRHVQYPQIPTFAPEMFARITQVDTLKRKQFVKGMEELAQEGAIQIFRELGAGMESVIVGVVGVLQFEVLERRLKAEYRVEVRRQPLPYTDIRWIQNDPDTIDIPGLSLTRDTLRVEDMRGGKLLVFTSPWNVDWATDHNPDLILSEFGNVAF